MLIWTTGKKLMLVGMAYFELHKVSSHLLLRKLIAGFKTAKWTKVIDKSDSKLDKDLLIKKYDRE